MNYDKLPEYTDKLLIQHDLTIWITVIVISNFIYCNLKNKNCFDNDWFYYSLASLFGLTIHSLFTNKITLLIIKKFNITDYNVKLALVDAIKWSTVYICNNILFTYLKNKKVTFDKNWFKLYGGIILGYIVFDLFIEKKLSSLSNNQDFSIDAFKLVIGIFVGYFLSYGFVHIDFFYTTISIVVALIVYYILVKKFIPPILL